MKNVIPLLEEERELERQFVSEVTGESDPATGWSATQVMFHVARWR